MKLTISMTQAERIIGLLELGRERAPSEEVVEEYDEEVQRLRPRVDRLRKKMERRMQDPTRVPHRPGRRAETW